MSVDMHELKSSADSLMDIVRRLGHQILHLTETWFWDQNQYDIENHLNEASANAHKINTDLQKLKIAYRQIKAEAKVISNGENGTITWLPIAQGPKHAGIYLVCHNNDVTYMALYDGEGSWCYYPDMDDIRESDFEHITYWAEINLPKN